MTWLARCASQCDGGEFSGREWGAGGSAYLSVSASICFCLLTSLAVYQSLSLSLPFCVILVPRTGGVNPAPLFPSLHTQLSSLSGSGADPSWAGFPGRGGGCVRMGEGRGTVIVLASSDAIGLPRLGPVPSSSFLPLLLYFPFISLPLPVPSESIRQFLL